MDIEPTPDTPESLPVRVTIDVLPESTPLAGSVQVAGSPMRPFAGWIDLVAAVQEAIAVSPADGRDPAEGEQL